MKNLSRFRIAKWSYAKNLSKWKPVSQKVEPHKNMIIKSLTVPSIWNPLKIILLDLARNSSFIEHN
jgi:hypothetical protein